MIKSNRTNFLRVFAALAMLMLSGWAIAQAPPLVTDDVDTPGPGKFEINLGTTGGKTAHAWDVDLFAADINFGVGEHGQLTFEIPWSYTKETGGPASTGLGEVGGGWKWRFHDREEGADGEPGGGYALAIYPQVFSSWSSRSSRKGLAPEHTTFVMPVLLNFEAGGFEVGTEVGRSFTRHEEDEWEAGVYLMRKCISEKFECMGEIHRTWGAGNTQTLVNLGFTYAINENLNLMVSAGREFGDHNDEQQKFVYYFGFQILR